MSFTRIFFATDVHGSERCFRKFINAGKFYKADVLILGGDLTGKRIVPIVKQPDGKFISYFLGTRYVFDAQEKCKELEEKICTSGYYPYYTDQQEAEELSADESKRDKLFSHLMVETAEKWVKLCEEHLKGTGINCFITGGNDDQAAVIDVLKSSDRITYPEGRVVRIDEHHEMISCGFSNITPFGCPRDIPEDELAKRIEEMASKIENMETCIFNFHCPPYDSGLDMAPELDEDLKPVIRAGQLNLVPCGSIAVKNAIVQYQPLLGLHGHIHESPGVAKIGKTLCLNPGSEYSEGILKGAIINLGERKIKGYILTSG